MELIVIGIVALAVGLALGWLLGGRGAAALKADHAASLAQGEMLRGLRQSLEAERDGAVSECSALRSRLAELTARSEEQAAAQAREREQLHEQFKQVAQVTLDEAQAKFLQRADERFRQSEETSGKQLKNLLQPVHARLEKYESAVGKIEAERREAFGLLSGQISAMREDAGRVSSQAANLVNALRNAPKARGRWGEQQLRNVLESCGLAEHTDFRMEVSVDAEGGRLRPDAVVRIPGGRSLVIDAKVSLNAYQDAFGAVEETERAAHLAAHVTSMRNHINSLGSKSYQDQFEDTPDFVVMFVPGEHFLAAALEHDPSMWDYAFARKVLLATPTNLVAIAKTVATVWRQEKLAGQAREIAELGKELYQRLSVMGGHVGRLGRNLDTAMSAYNAFVGSLESQVLTQAKRFETLQIETGGKAIEPLPIVETTARPVVKLVSDESAA
ncbi:MAG TPA: DNA recombination protein RmuC [Sphingomonas sp.]|nr:DNA recombination protein RmuC [Sphingomonas sp.]